MVFTAGFFLSTLVIIIGVIILMLWSIYSTFQDIMIQLRTMNFHLDKLLVETKKEHTVKVTKGVKLEDLIAAWHDAKDPPEVD